MTEEEKKKNIFKNKRFIISLSVLTFIIVVLYFFFAPLYNTFNFAIWPEYYDAGDFSEGLAFVQIG